MASHAGTDAVFARAGWGCSRSGGHPPRRGKPGRPIVIVAVDDGGMRRISASARQRPSNDGPHAGRQRSFAPDGDAVRSALRDNVGVSDGFRATPTQTRYTNRRRSCHCCGACSLHWRGSGLGRARLSARKHADGCLGNRWQARAARDGANPLLTLQCRVGAAGLRSLSLARMTIESHPAVMQTHGMTG
ncbi:hypothetical protein SAMN06296065_12136 [Novosphingobium panipatense]|uniref:Uncharacterized protein n=1 Tax=Novosphingobium panipatense TaxID=428991 RepID=A0ABY1QXR3_9SPHN|nr:hypothetical protein SAMN06296065_12136 [Novosphingobium panipatense]